MVSIWMIVGLLIAAVSVSTLGAAFSVAGIGALFSGALVAVCAMAISLEFAKFILAAYLHQRWRFLNRVFKTYLFLAIVVLSLITSMGIFGFLSNAYQSASATLEAENIRLETLRQQQSRNSGEIARINRGIEEIPANRVTRRLQARTEAEPALKALAKASESLEAQIGQTNLRILEVKQKVGPLIYIAKAFNMEIDNVVKYLILVFVTVFDPLAICLVIATSDSLESRRRGKTFATPTAAPSADPSPVAATEPAAEPTHPSSLPPASEAAAAIANQTRPTPSAAPASAHDGEVLQMKFADD